MTCTRGTSNGNERGNNETRRERREWLVATYRADVDVLPGLDGFVPVPLGEGIPACRCYRCPALLTVDTVTADRIKPGAEGGQYRTPKRDTAEGVTNIRPACGPCNSATGGALGSARKKAS